ncbi:MAG: Ubiquinone biosynthesis monooxygenase UbiB [Alphaproteobacteria bacterium]|nr:Ubiquinone biosynthesis monooxygenase UbiB [Alphaproteobacteria bacterium]
MAQNDKNTGAKRLGRYARVSTKMGGLAARMAGEKFFGIKVDRDDHARILKEALGNLRGPLMKVAQLLATIPDALPPEYAAELQELQSHAPPMGWPFVKRRMQAELGPDWQNKFSDFPREAAAAASLGQVHKATTLSGEIVACKLQYPDMESAVEADLKQLRLMFSLYESYDKAIQTKHVVNEIATRLREELDYTREARNQQAYAEMLSNENHVHVPRVIPELGGKRLLTTEWLEGAPILDFKKAPLQMRNQIALNLFRAWYVPLYQYGVVHGDPHLGNYKVRQNGDINLLDFGCIRVFPPQFIKGILDLYHALMKNDRALAVHAFEAWGFKNLSNELIDTLTIWARFLYQSVMDDRVRIIGKSEGTVYGRDTAMQVHAALRKHGGITVPREFVFMDRAALGLGSVFIHLQAEVNWHRLFEELTADFDVAALEKRQKALIKKFDLAV